MEADRFDALSRRLGALDTRRGLLRLLGGLPVVGALTAFWDDQEAAAERPIDRVHHRAG
jgi:hypothetical protein